MVRWVRPDTQTLGLRDRLIAEYESRLVGRPWAERVYEPLLMQLRSGRPMIFPGWQLAGQDLEMVRRGVHAYYLVDADDSVREVDHQELVNVHGWDIPAARRSGAGS